jgi:RimJ/RimL family protein N-acetyltransferase
LKGERVTLRKVRDGDIAERQKLGRHPEVVKGFGVALSRPETMTREEAKRWVTKVADHPNAWIIECGKRLIGSVRLDNIEPSDRRCSLAISIDDPELLNKGLGAEAIRLCSTYAFQELKLHRISVRVLASNERAIRCYKKCGFVEEGRERESAFVNGRWEDDLILGLIAA